MTARLTVQLAVQLSGRLAARGALPAVAAALTDDLDQVDDPENL